MSGQEALPHTEFQPRTTLGAVSEAAIAGAYEASQNLEADIQRAEATLGLHTTADRLLEASLVIDYDFLRTALITDWPNPERIFGDEAWAGHLDARILAKEYGDRPLTVDFVLALHRCFLDRVTPGVRDQISESPYGRGGTSVNGELAPTYFADRRIAIINSNPLLRFLPDSVTNDPNIGYIGYMSSSAQERRAHLEKLCDTFNTEHHNLVPSPYAGAARMQRTFIAIHPLFPDFNGRTSRVLMNWALENANLSPSIISHVDADLLMRETGWVPMVMAGSDRYHSYKHAIAAGETDSITLFGLDEAVERYKTLLGSITTPVFKPGEWYESLQCAQFLADVGVELVPSTAPQPLLYQSTVAGVCW